MKKTVVFTFLFFAACAAFAQSGTITEISGSVEIKAGGAAGFVPAKMGDSIDKNTVISTGFRSTALINLGSANILVRPLTRLSLDELVRVQNVETINVNLQAGRVRVDVKPPAGSKADFTIKTPTATASVRGTDFDFDTRSIHVNEGAVAYSGDMGPAVLVMENNDSSVNDISGRVADPIEVYTTTILPPPPPGSGAPRGPITELPLQDPDVGIGIRWDN
ncbi:MAG: FecR family protein [Spirochaetales bacterium]|jgi:hypothetical protein|nr:FecR family protein [Spirochaetales bacterium]